MEKALKNNYESFNFILNNKKPKEQLISELFYLTILIRE